MLSEWFPNGYGLRYVVERYDDGRVEYHGGTDPKGRPVVRFPTATEAAILAALLNTQPRPEDDTP